MPVQTITEGGSTIPTPFIAHWDGDHFVVVERIRSRHVDLVDPAIGRRRLTKAGFLEHGTIALLFGAGDQASRPAGPVLPATVSPFKVVLAPLIWRHRRRLLLTIAISLLLTILGLAVPAATALITNSLADGETPSTAWILIAPLLAAAVGLLALVRGLGAATLQRGLSQDLTVGVARRMFESEFRYFERRSTGDLSCGSRRRTWCAKCSGSPSWVPCSTPFSRSATSGCCCGSTRPWPWWPW
jgi:ABC-type bacteriocin/lantibiotic exporter with double-glycine peptidase domain